MINKFGLNDKSLSNLALIFLFISLNVFFFTVIPFDFLKHIYILNFLSAIVFYLILFGKRFHGVFVFIGTLTLFQGGLLLSNCSDFDLQYIPLMDANITISQEAVRMTIFLISMSYWILLLGGYLGDKLKISDRLKTYDNSQIEKKLFLVIFFISLPFYIYKQIHYFLFYLQEGYMGFYRSKEYLDSINILVRAISFFAPISFIGYFLLESDRKKIIIIGSIFFIFNLFTLISGFRGPFFTFWLTFVIFFCQKYDIKINFFIIFLLVYVVAIIGQIISYTREGFYEFNILGNYLFSFLKQQGVSFYVTAMGIEFSEEFKPNILYYLMLELIAAFDHKILSMPGNSFATDLTIKINYSAYLMGFGTGSSYLAEAYLLGGPFMVFVVTFLIGYSLSRLASIFTQVNIYFKILIFSAIQYIIYLPRDILLNFTSHLIKVAIYVTILYSIIFFIKNILTVLGSRNYETSTTN